MSTDEQRPPTGFDEYLPAQAAEFVKACKDAGINLDFQPRTLPFVDKFMAANRASAGTLAEPAGAYVGEVIRKETGGVWYEHEGKPALDVGEAQVDPIAAVAELFEKGGAQFGEMKISGCKQYCEWVIKMQRQWIEGTLIGTADSMATLRTSMTTDAKLAGSLVAQCQTAIHTGKLTWAESLDFTPDSLDGVERILGKMHNHYKFAAAGAGPSDEQIASTSKTWGIYIGEVIRRFYGGQWSAAQDGTLSLAIGEAAISPIAKARKRIIDGPTENVRYYFSSIAKVLQG
ncbi:MAG: hypothetical protein K2Y23_09205 [Cyanobacteria bacterium]|nr:hypothetical protein [Cyanobacteriota bacterium]